MYSRAARLCRCASVSFSPVIFACQSPMVFFPVLPSMQTAAISISAPTVPTVGILLTSRIKTEIIEQIQWIVENLGVFH